MKRQETIPIEYVSLTQEDLAELATHVAAPYLKAFDERVREYDRKTEEFVREREKWVRDSKAGLQSAKAKAQPPGSQTPEVEAAARELARDRARIRDLREDRAESREALTTILFKPSFRVATRESSFEDADWEQLWPRVSTHDVRRITMEQSTDDPRLNVSISLVGRGKGVYENRIEIGSSDAAAFDAERGFVTDLMRRRAAVARRRVTTGVVGLMIWYVGPIVLLSAAAVWGYRGFSSVPGAQAAVLMLWLIGFLPVVFGADFVLARLAPRVTVQGVGPYERTRGWLEVIALGVLASALFSAAMTMFQGW